MWPTPRASTCSRRAEFDAAVCNMALMDIEDAAGAIREVGRVLRAAAACRDDSASVFRRAQRVRLGG